MANLGGKEEDIIIQRKLFVKEEDTLLKLSSLLDKLQAFVRIEKVSGKVIFERSDLPLKSKLFFALAGRYFWCRVNKTENYSATITQLAGIVGKPVTSLSGPLAELVRYGYIEKISSGQYRVAYYSIEKFLA